MIEFKQINDVEYECTVAGVFYGSILWHSRELAWYFRPTETWLMNGSTLNQIAAKLSQLQCQFGRNKVEQLRARTPNRGGN